MNLIPLIELSGTPKEIGLQHGKQLKNRIHKTITFYKKAFELPEEEILEKAKHFKDIIMKATPHLAEEIEAIAQGSGTNPLWIYALNSRTEILSHQVQECTTVYFSETNLLGQNWDWTKEFENLAILLKINNEFITLTEPGMLGKIGINKSGLGISLNFLTPKEKLSGLPIHILLRLLLETKNLSKAKEIIKTYSGGKTGLIVIANKEDSLLVELTKNKTFYLSKEEIFLHTNHYLHAEIKNNEDKLKSSYQRFKRAKELSKTIQNLTIEGMKKILLDKEGSLPICRSFNEEHRIGIVGTITTIIMDLENKQITLTPGSPLNNEFVTYSL